MLNKKVYQLIFIALIIISLNAGAVQAEVKITFLHTNDMHGQLFPLKGEGEFKKIGGFEALQAVFRRERAIALSRGSNIIQIDGGDVFQGTPVGDLTKGKAVYKLMSELGYDIGVPGNHDFDISYKGLRKVKKYMRYPLLCANIIDRRTGRIPSIMKQSLMKEIKGVKIAFIGLVVEDLPVLTLATGIKDLKILNAEKILPGIIRKMRAKGADLIVLLSHVGIERDREIAKNVKGIDIILGGHSHTKMKEPDLIGRTMIFQSGSKSQYVSKIELDLEDKTGKILDYRSKLILIKQSITGASLLMRRKIKKLSDPILKDMEKDIGITRKKLVKVSGPIATLDKQIEVRKAAEEYPYGIRVLDQGGSKLYILETNLSQIVCDAFAETAGIDIAFSNISGIRAGIPKGKLNYLDIYKLLPFSNYIWVIKLKGKEILKFYDFSEAKYRGPFLQVSGLKVKYRLTSDNKGFNLEGIYYKGSKIEPEKEYTVCTNNFLASGGDNYAGFTKGKIIRKIPVLMRDSLAEYIKKRKIIDPVVEPRIIFE